MLQFISEWPQQSFEYVKYMYVPNGLDQNFWVCVCKTILRVLVHHLLCLNRMKVQLKIYLESIVNIFGYFVKPNVKYLFSFLVSYYFMRVSPPPFPFKKKHVLSLFYIAPKF